MQNIFSRALFDAINEGILIIDMTGKVLAINRSFYKIHGIDEKIKGNSTVFESKNYFRLHDLEGNELPFEQWPFFLALNNIYVKGKVFKATNVISGISFYGLFNSRLLKGNESEEDAVIISVTDITSYIEAKQTIEQKEKLLSAIINNSQDGIHVLNLEKGQYDFMSPAQTKLTGFPITDLMFKLDEAALRLHPDDREQVIQYMAKVASKDPPDQPIEYRWRVKSGEYRWFSDNRRAIFENGKPVKLVGVSRDITDKRHDEEELKNINELLTNMLYMAAHDIKSPIVNMKIMLQLLEDNKSELDFYLPRFNSSVNQLENVIEGLSTLIHAQVNDDIEVNKINLKEEVENTLLSNQAKLDECQGSVVCDIDDDFTFNYVKPYINSILGNLISNAIKYRDTKRPLEILISAEKLDQRLKLIVSDNGSGIDLDRFGNQIFKPFKRFNTKVKGSGIGLYLINSMIRKNGGFIEVESEPGKGSSFICYLVQYPASSAFKDQQELFTKVYNKNSDGINN